MIQRLMAWCVPDRALRRRYLTVGDVWLKVATFRSVATEAAFADAWDDIASGLAAVDDERLEQIAARMWWSHPWRLGKWSEDA